MHAYVVRAVAPLVVGVVAGTGYTLWAVLDSAPSGLALVLTLAAVGLAATALAAMHDTGSPGFARVWRLAGTGLLLLSLVVAAVPGLDLGADPLPLDLVVGLVATALLVGAGLLVGDRLARAELAGGTLAVARSLLDLRDALDRAGQLASGHGVGDVPHRDELIRALTALERRLRGVPGHVPRTLACRALLERLHRPSRPLVRQLRAARTVVGGTWAGTVRGPPAPVSGVGANT